MITVPAVVWRGDSAVRGVLTGTCLGLFFGGVAWLDSGMWLAGVVVLVVLGVGSGVWMARRMVRYWPSAGELTGAQRHTVADSVRHGRAVDTALAHAALDYRRGLHAVADHHRPVRWLIVVLLVIAVAVAAWDAVNGSWGNVVASLIYLLIIGFEVVGLPRWQRRLLANADKATNTT